MSKRIYRNVANSKLGGVCAGIADYLDIDPTIVRILFILGFFFVGSSILFYLILWLIIPAHR